ncbi:MAG: alpha-2-macroglobulin [Verrucomicrobiota bacterium]|jgi:uncharacterized protein YfaS (alpha-2-macroglobulin family)
MKSSFFFTASAAAVVFLLVSCSGNQERSERVQLMLSDGALAPSTTFEVRFDRPMVDPGAVGQLADPSPLIIKPPLGGRFIWLSRRSGIYTPDEATRLGTAYRFTLRGGLKDATGQRLDARLDRTLRTPPFAVEHGWLGFNSSNTPASPEIKLNFNADILPEAARGYLEFRSQTGQRLPVLAVHPTVEESFHLNQWYSGDVMRTWHSRFTPNFPNAVQPRSVVVPIDEGQQRTNLVLNRLIITSEKPLPVGIGWKLIIAQGLPSADRSLHLSSTMEIPLGNVIDFAVAGFAAHNARENGKAIGIRFSKELSSELNSSNLMEWISIRPSPTNLTARRYQQMIELAGSFEPHQDYRVSIRAGLPAEDGFKLGRAWKQTVEFSPLPPRLYLPAFSAEQIASGRRVFDLVAVNVPEARIRAKRLDRHTLIHALRGYESYFTRGENRDWNEPYREVDFNVIAGQTIYSSLLNTSSTNLDESVRMPIHWDEVMGRDRHGAVFLTAEQPPLRTDLGSKQGTQSIIQLTDLGLAWKTAAHSATIHVFSHATGKPVPKVTVRLVTDENETLAELPTDSQGLVTLPLSTNAVWILAEFGDDLHAARLREHEVYLYNFGLRYDWNREERDRHEVFLFTDRPLYRAGETVHFKGLIRERDGESLGIPNGTRLTLQLTDPKEEKVLETNLVISAAGSVAASIALPDGLRGHYSLALHWGERTYTHSVQVADFQPNAFAVLLDTKAAYSAGETPRVAVDATYLMGAPLTRAKVAWSMEARDEGFYPKGFDDFLCTTEWLDDQPSRSRSSFVSHGEGVYSSKSNFVISPPMSFNPAAPQPRSVHLRTEVTDLNQQTITRSADFVAHSSEFYLGLGRFKNILRAGEPLDVHVVAIDADGQPHGAPVEVALKLSRVDRIAVPMEGAGRARRYRTETFITNVVSATMQTQPVHRNGGKWEVLPGPASPPVLVPDQPGQWLLEARALDAAGREVLSIAQFYVAGRSENAWSYRNEMQMDIAPDKPAYIAGDTATLLLKAPFSGHALVTIEREKVLRSFVAELHGNAPTIRVVIEEGDAPNVFVSVLLLRGSDDSPHRFKMPEHRLGYCELKVINPRSQLQVAILPDAAAYRPNQTVNVIAEILDGTGQPAANTEVTLYAVDEGILSIMGYATPDPQAYFFRARPIEVRCAITLPGLFAEDPGQQFFGNKGYLIGGGGRERVRKDFLPCAYWNAALVTDATGQVTASFIAPDSLTRYRIVAVAHNGRHQFGSGSAHFEVNKPLMIEPALPRFAHVTDKLIARGVVHNQTAEAGRVEVSIQLDDQVRLTGAGVAGRAMAQLIVVPAKTSAAVEFPVEFMEAGLSKWIWRARFLEAADAVRPISNSSAARQYVDAAESTILVEYLSPMLREIHLARSEAAETNLLAGANPQLLEGRGTVAVRVSNSRLGELGEALRYLLHYPYGCVEQTGSSLLPWIVLRNAPVLAPDLGKTPGDFDRAIRAGVQRLLAMQTDSGGLSYWPGGRQPMFWGSGYGGFVLALARRDGHPVTAGKFDKLLKYLSAELRGTTEASGDGMDFSASCLALYTLALAGKAEPAYHELLFRKREQLSSDNRALLAMAILETSTGGAMAAELLSSRTNLPRSDSDWFACDSRDLALQLLAWTRHQPGDQKVDTLVTELVQSRLHGHWSTTQGNAWALFALKEYSDRVERSAMAADGRLAWADRSREFALPKTSESISAIFPIVCETANLPLLLSNPGHRRLYTQVTLEARPTLARQPRQDRGFGISRSYLRIDDDNRLHAPDTLHVGDRVLVSLTLEIHQPAHFLAIDDALPAVLEPLNPEFASQETSRASVPGNAAELHWYHDHFEFRADRALFFRDHVETTGRYTIRYLTRVRAAGTATAPAAKVEEMYHPERFGLTEAATLTALPLE